ncbi:HXXEE domain-containing protein [Streptococcus panodentis]|uniref:HXXEE domain-containing protein n=1 Tax=Streptococcus panodentis TaxID=1581472 RepID=A0ABS5AZW0_9STRE|nr:MULTISPECIES: HXXEE domain-containing protein [Streptococcus]KXT82559.1 hypothetical protein STRDD11_01823 [Streptococcus sp. DD11]MBP2622107.1 HXXEE domain-containing protein [Streptococcus panodentis]
MPISLLSFVTLSLFMLHEFDEIILIRPWIQQNENNPRFQTEMFIAGKKAYPSTEGIAAAIAEEFLIAFLIFLMAIVWQIPELALALGFCHTLHLLGHITQVLRFRRWVPGGFTAVATFPILILIFIFYLAYQPVSWLLILLLSPFLMVIILLNLSLLHSQAGYIQSCILRLTRTQNKG